MGDHYQAKEESAMEKYAAVIFFALAFLIGFAFMFLVVTTGVFALALVAAISASL